MVDYGIKPQPLPPGGAERCLPGSADAILAGFAGDRAGLLLGANGQIIAANDRAAGILGHTAIALEGSRFGEWSSLDESVELSIVSKKGDVTPIRAHRHAPRHGEQFTLVMLEEIAAPLKLSLNELIGDAVGQLYRESKAPLSFFCSALPERIVRPELRPVVMDLLRLLARISEGRHVLEVMPEPNGADAIVMRTVSDSEGFDGDDAAFPFAPAYQAFQAIENMGGRFHFGFDDRLVSLTIFFS